MFSFISTQNVKFVKLRSSSPLFFNILVLNTKETAILVFFTLLHLGFYQYFLQLPAKKPNTAPIFIEFIHPKPKPPESKLEEPKPKLIDAPPKPKQPPKELPKQKGKPKKQVKKPVVKKEVYKPRLQQESIVKVQAEEAVVKEVVEHAQPISEPVVKKLDNKPEEREESPEPPHTPVITKVTGIGSCSSTLNHYPAEAREQGLEGTVKIKVQVLASGSVGSASIAKSSEHSILDQSVLANVYNCNFEPAEKDGVPIASKVIIPVHFKLD